MKWTSVLVVLAMVGCGDPAIDAVLNDTLTQGSDALNGAEPPEGQEVPEAPDLCPDDPEKLSPGICGCNVAETDADSDGTPDCLDECPEDPSKTTLGLCACGVPDTDTDADDSPDCIDLCPNDPEKIEPGRCGCGQPEIGIDTDADGVPDCVDGCPLDPIKIVPGICGCGIDDLDLDRDGFPDLCLDNCPFTFNPNQLDSDFDGLGDTCDPFPVGPGDVFSFLTPAETELFLSFVFTLNADIDDFVNLEYGLALGASSGVTATCSLECIRERSRISLKREGTAPSAIDAAALLGISLTLGLAEWAEVDAFNCENYPNRSFECASTQSRGLPPLFCTVGGPPCN